MTPLSSPRSTAGPSGATRPLLSLTAAAACIALWALPGEAAPLMPQTDGQAARSGGGTIPVQVVAGRLVVSCDLSTSARRIPANLFLEIEGRHGLQLHNRAAAGLRAETQSGQRRPITMHFPDFDVTVPSRELGDEDLFEEFTKYNSVEIGENALVGSIGVGILKDWAVTLDIGDGEVRLAPLGEVGAAPPLAPRVEPDGTIVGPLSVIDDMIWLSARWEDGTPGGLMLGTSQYDTRIDRRAARARGKRAGDVGPIRIGGLDLHEYVAFRPEPVVQVHPDGVIGITGLNLLESLELSVDRATRTLRVRPAREPNFPEQDLEFFQARADEDPEALRQFLETHGGKDPSAKGADDGVEPTRLAAEAARLLLDYRIADAAPEDEVKDAVTWVHRTMKGDLRTTRMLDLMKEMSDAGETTVVVEAGRLGIEAGRDDRYPNAVHEVHGLLGRTLMDEGEQDEAWRHLLSAAFGLPEDGRINYDLGRFYEAQGRPRRAYSRYIQAVITPEAGGLAIEALQRVQPLIAAEEDGDGTFSVDTIERMIAGKVRNFGAASTFEATEEQPFNRVVLAEFFTNGHLGNEERGGAIGGALGFEGLISHFQGGEVAFLEYHLPAPRPDALCSSVARARAERLGIDEPTVIVLDGAAGSPGAGKWRDAEAIYGRARGTILDRMRTESNYEVDIAARLEDGMVIGDVIVYGDDEDGLSLQVVLAEKGVLYPGSSGVVVHRYVARGSLIDEDEGVPVDMSEVGPSFPFERTLQSFEEEQLAFLESLEAEGLGNAPRISTSVDPDQVRVVAFLFSERTGRVLASGMCVPEGVETGEEAVEIK